VSSFKRIKNTLVYAAAVCGYKIAQAVPRKAGLWFFGNLGAFAFIFPNEEKRRTIRHLQMVYGNEWDNHRIYKTARDVYVNLGKNLFDSIWIASRTMSKLDNIISTDSFDEIDAAYNSGKGIIAITAHIGCFEMLLHYFALRGYRTFAIGRKSFDERIEQLLRKNRSGDNIEYMNRTESPRALMRKLQDGKVFGVLIDQDTRVESVFAQFLGKMASTPSGPVKMAMKMGVPVFVVTTARVSKYKHHIFLSKCIEFNNTGDFEKDLIDNVGIANDLICDTIKKYPSQWVWMHRRWKNQPHPPAPSP
jgi:KDO2-lipid IV(A) lauroyltransferase